MAIRRSTKHPGFVEDEQKGLIIPERIHNRNAPELFDTPFGQFLNKKPLGTVSLTSYRELSMTRDKDTAIPVPPPYMSWMDNSLCRAVAGGYMANVGYSGVADPVITSIVSKLVKKCASWEPMVSGQRLARRLVMDAIASANGSKNGWLDFASKIAGGLFVDNAGVAYAQLPIGSIAFENWEQYGMMAEPIPGYDDIVKPDGRSNQTVPRFYYLTTTNAKLRSNRMLETIDVLHIKPTGNSEWPFWIRKKLGNDFVWVLIPSTIGGHQVLTTIGEDYLHPQYGQSGVWRYISVLIQDILISDAIIESVIYSPPQGIIWGVGLDYAEQLSDAMDNLQQQREDAGIRLFKGVIKGGSESTDANVIVVKWRDMPVGFTQEKWKEQKEDYAAMCMNASISMIAQRIGRGSATNALLGYDQQSESLYAIMRVIFEGIYNWLSDQTITHVIWKSDRTTRVQFESLEILMKSIKLAQESGNGETFDAFEIRNLFEQKGGVDIPQNQAETDASMLNVIRVNTVAMRIYRKLSRKTGQLEKGEYVVMDNRQLAIVEEDATTQFAWIRPLMTNRVVLMRQARLKYVPFDN